MSAHSLLTLFLKTCKAAGFSEALKPSALCRQTRIKSGFFGVSKRSQKPLWDTRGKPFPTTRNEVTGNRTWVRIPPASAKIPWKCNIFRGFLYLSMVLCFIASRSNVAHGALIYGARHPTRKILHSAYARIMYAQVPKWCPHSLKSYKKQRGAIKTHVVYSSISLLFFLLCFAGFTGVSGSFCGCNALW